MKQPVNMRNVASGTDTNWTVHSIFWQGHSVRRTLVTYHLQKRLNTHDDRNESKLELNVQGNL